jgi:hypothetical protein
MDVHSLMRPQNIPRCLDAFTDSVDEGQVNWVNLFPVLAPYLANQHRFFLGAAKIDRLRGNDADVDHHPGRVEQRGDAV